MKYLGSVVSSPALGDGVVVFEEDFFYERWRVILIAFATQTVEVIPARLNGHGYRLTGVRIAAQSHPERLWGHDAIEGGPLGLKGRSERYKKRRWLRE